MTNFIWCTYIMISVYVCLHKIGLELIIFMKSVLYKDTKMSYNYINHTHVVSNLICSVEMEDIVSKYWEGG